MIRDTFVVTAFRCQQRKPVNPLATTFGWEPPNLRRLRRCTPFELTLEDVEIVGWVGRKIVGCDADQAARAARWLFRSTRWIKNLTSQGFVETAFGKKQDRSLRRGQQ
jgi:hypothetical protein